MNHVRWIAWGVIELEKLERMQRRNYIKKIREDVTPLGITFDCGGVSSNPWYQMVISASPALGRAEKRQAHGGTDAARKICQWLLMELNDHVGGEDGGVRRAGDEASGSQHGLGEQS